MVGVHSDRAFWGTVPNPGAGFSVGVRLDDFAATSASGTARVMGVDPLRIALDVVASGSGRQVLLQGTLALRHESSVGSCFE